MFRERNRNHLHSFHWFAEFSQENSSWQEKGSKYRKDQNLIQKIYVKNYYDYRIMPIFDQIPVPQIDIVQILRLLIIVERKFYKSKLKKCQKVKVWWIEKNWRELVENMKAQDQAHPIPQWIVMTVSIQQIVSGRKKVQKVNFLRFDY